MAAPAFTSEHPGLKVVDDVATILAAGLGTPDALAGVLAAMRRGLGLLRCRMWLRAADGVGFTALGAPGDPAELTGPGSPVHEWIAAGPTSQPTPGGVLVRRPLIHEDVPLG